MSLYLFEIKFSPVLISPSPQGDKRKEKKRKEKKRKEKKRKEEKRKEKKRKIERMRNSRHDSPSSSTLNFVRDRSIRVQH